MKGYLSCPVVWGNEGELWRQAGVSVSYDQGGGSSSVCLFVTRICIAWARQWKWFGT